MRPIATTAVLAALLLVAASASAPAGGLAQETATDGAETTTAGPKLDLREANVVGVAFQAAEDGRYDVSVTLLHDDDGEPGYANWWQVETLNGSELGRRDLAHPHGTRPFTRSARIDVPETVSLIVVRGHDQTHDYGGQVMVVDLGTGATETLQQGPERRNLGDCAVLQRGADPATTTTRTADGMLRSANATATTTVAGAAGNETDLVRCPWEESTGKTVNRTRNS